MKYSFLSLLIILACSSCDMQPDIVPSVPGLLRANYELLPEEQISMSTDSSVYAAYASPTDRYAHAVLGDGIEAGQLVVVVDETFYDLSLGQEYVFEDIRPRLYDVDGDGDLEIITIRSNVDLGAGIVIYEIRDNELFEYAFVPEIGNSNKWLNLVTINDLDNDGIVELVWVETPHIGGILKVAKIERGTLLPISEMTLFKNHAIGERNLCLSVVTELSAEKNFFLPTHAGDEIARVKFENNELKVLDYFDQVIDFSQVLSSQFDFTNLIEEAEDNCIFVE